MTNLDFEAFDELMQKEQTGAKSPTNGLKTDKNPEGQSEVKKGSEQGKEKADGDGNEGNEMS